MKQGKYGIILRLEIQVEGEEVMNKTIEDKAKSWLSRQDLDLDIKEELTTLWAASLQGDQEAIEEISDRFYRELSFGTGGLRGKLGAGTNRMNRYSVEKTTMGLVAYIKENCFGSSVAIGYDSRNKSLEFAGIVAEIITGAGLDAFLYDTLMPAPALSFAVRLHGCAMGIMVTASHNPAEYNGYKVYDNRGCQVSEDEANKILALVEKQEWFASPLKCESGKLTMMGEASKNAYYDAVYGESTGIDCGTVSVAYTPLNGAGLVPVLEILKRIGVKDMHVVPEQEYPDGDFPTCPYPNPEKKAALALGLALADKKKTDILLATDPDSDRLGVAVLHEGDYHLPTGNQIGVLLTDYICHIRKTKATMPKNPYIVRTVVTTKMGDEICKKYGVRVVTTLTGFKYIGSIIGEEEDQGREDDYIFGFEESYGYLSGTYVRDKDGVNAAMLVCEMVAYYKEQGKTLMDRLEELYKEYGYYRNHLLDFQFPGAKGMETMSTIMEDLRKNPFKEVHGHMVTGFVDYEEGVVLPPSNLVEFLMENDRGFAVRPSGTEPKLKIYIFGTGESSEDVETFLEEMSQVLSQWIENKEV